MCLINLKPHIGGWNRVNCIAVNPARPEQLAIGARDAYIRVYDRRKINLCSVRALEINFSPILIYNFIDISHPNRLMKLKTTYQETV